MDSRVHTPLKYKAGLGLTEEDRADPGPSHSHHWLGSVDVDHHAPCHRKLRATKESIADVAISAKPKVVFAIYMRLPRVARQHNGRVYHVDMMVIAAPGTRPSFAA